MNPAASFRSSEAEGFNPQNVNSYDETNGWRHAACDGSFDGGGQLMRREPRASRILRRFARLLAAGSVLLYGALLGGGLFDEPSAAYVALTAALAFAAVASIAAWLSDSVGGVLLVVAGVATAIWVGLVAERNPTAAILLLSGPFLVAGLALLSASALREQRRWEEKEA
jgi:hypothetical protein